MKKMFPNVTQDTFVEYDDHKNDRETHFTVPSTIGPEDGRHLFSYLGIFLTYITPRDLHVGMKSALTFALIEKFQFLLLFFFRMVIGCVFLFLPMSCAVAFS